eukprot:g9323.t1
MKAAHLDLFKFASRLSNDFTWKKAKQSEQGLPGLQSGQIGQPQVWLQNVGHSQGFIQLRPELCKHIAEVMTAGQGFEVLRIKACLWSWPLKIAWYSAHVCPECHGMLHFQHIIWLHSRHNKQAPCNSCTKDMLLQVATGHVTPENPGSAADICWKRKRPANFGAMTSPADNAPRISAVINPIFSSFFQMDIAPAIVAGS